MNLFEMGVEDIDIVDIAHALSNICRFGGHTKRFYSVAQHSIAVSYMVGDRLALHGLLHDAAEAYIGDMVSPLKKRIPEYRRLDEDITRVICRKFDIDFDLMPCIKWADRAALQVECIGVRDYDPGSTISHEQAEADFLNRYETCLLQASRKGTPASESL